MQLRKKKAEKKKFRASTGFKPVTSANTGAMLYQLSYEATYWEPGHCCGFYLSSEERINEIDERINEIVLKIFRSLLVQSTLVIMDTPRTVIWLRFQGFFLITVLFFFFFF